MLTMLELSFRLEVGPEIIYRDFTTTTITDADGFGPPQGMTTFVTLTSIQNGECVASFKFARGPNMAVVLRASDIRCLPAYIVFERH